MKNEILSREQQAALDFQVSSSPFVMSFKDSKQSDLSEFAEGFIDSLSFFGVSELYYRGKERVEVGKENKSRVEYLNKMAVRNNEKGLKVLQLITPCVDRHIKEVVLSESSKGRETSVDKDRNRPDFSDFRYDAIAFFEDLETKPEDTKKLIAVLDEVIKAAEKGEKNVYEFINIKAKELAKVRKGKDRGVVDNIPWWKIVAIAVILGLATAEIWRCYIRKQGCSKVEQAAYKAGYTLASLVLKFC